MRRNAALVLAGVLAALAAAAAVGWIALGIQLDRLALRAEADLALAADRLIGRVQRQRDLAVSLAEHPLVRAAAATGGAGPGITPLFLRHADRAGIEQVHLFDASGRALMAVSAGGLPPVASFPLERALSGALGVSTAIGGGARHMLVAAPVRAADARPAGALVLVVDAARIELGWSGHPQAIRFTDAAGRVFATNRSELLQPPPGAERVLAALPGEPGRHDLWRLDAGPYLPDIALHLERPLPLVGLTAEVLADAAPGLRAAGLWALVVLALALAAGGVGLALAARRRVLAERLAHQAALSVELEARVATRTRELSQANAALRREVAERSEAERALKRAQEDLVQAGKLAALGKMSAGISHELNQPLMAIRTYAENGALLLARGRAETAGENLTRIGELAARMGRIIRNLRAFARQESVPAGRVDLVAVVDTVLEMATAPLAQADVQVDWPRPAAPVAVLGGEVRLQQVVMNLVSNAIDAMRAGAERRLSIRIEQVSPGGPVRLRLADTGPGLADPERVFDPFYSTKSVGGDEGMGLGLSISYGIVQSFGGAIRGRNLPGGGAEFTVDLAAWGAEQAA